MFDVYLGKIPIRELLEMEPSAASLQTLIQGGAVGLALVLILVFVWYVKHTEKQANLDRKERAEETKKFSEMLTNHLSMLIGDYIKSQKDLTGVMTHMSDVIENSQKNCTNIQVSLMQQVDRLKESN